MTMPGTQMEQLYQEIILDHSRAPHHAGLREPFDAQVHQVNPTCGDEITLRVSLAGAGFGGAGAASDAAGVSSAGVGAAGGDPAVTDVSYQALGCSISQASASVLADLVIGRRVSEAMGMFEAFDAMITSKGQDGGDEEVLGDAVAFAGVAKYPNRVKCALLGWMAFKQAVTQATLDGSADQQGQPGE